MNTMHRATSVALLIAAVAAVSLATPARADDAYTALKLTNQIGGSQIDFSALNDLGQLAGCAKGANGIRHAILTGPNGVGMIDIGTAGGTEAMAQGLNDSGQVVGYYLTPDNYQGAFVTGPNGAGITDLGFLTPQGVSGFTPYWARDINNNGQAVGDAKMGNHTHAFITGPDGVTDIGTLGGLISSPDAINASGQVVGRSTAADHKYYGFITGPNGVGMTALGDLGGGANYPGDINATGRVVGHSSVLNPDGSRVFHAYATGEDGVGITDLGMLDGYTESFACGINNIGQVVGYCGIQGTNLSNRAFITGPNALDMIDLNSLVTLPGGDYLRGAQAINNRGQILAYSAGEDSYLLTPVPEPATLALLALGGLGLIRRRRTA